jgi:hypothetical protein
MMELSSGDKDLLTQQQNEQLTAQGDLRLFQVSLKCKKYPIRMYDVSTHNLNRLLHMIIYVIMLRIFNVGINVPSVTEITALCSG